jgi:hypothetical protein
VNQGAAFLRRSQECRLEPRWVRRQFRRVAVSITAAPLKATTTADAALGRAPRELVIKSGKAIARARLSRTRATLSASAAAELRNLAAGRTSGLGSEARPQHARMLFTGSYPLRRARAMRWLHLALLVATIGCMPGCAPVSSVKHTAPEHKSWDDVKRDTADCETSIASHSTAVAEGAKVGAWTSLWTGLEGAALGAAHGAWHGGASGAADGSWIGAAAGVFVGLVVGVVTGIQRSNQERQPQTELYKTCLRDRGYTIAGDPINTSGEQAQRAASTISQTGGDDVPASGTELPK